MSARTFKSGDVVFDIHGRQGRYVSRVGAGYAVEPEYQDEDDGEPYFDAIQTWRDVFKKPPTEVLEQRIAELEVQHAAAANALHEVEKRHREFETEERARKHRITTHEKLGQLDAFLSGKITHFVIDEGSSITIDEAEKALEDRDNYRNRGLRLLTLYGDSKGDIAWNLARYGDGSGTNKIVHPCLSLQDAQETAVRVLAKHFEYVREKGNAYYAGSAEKTALQLGQPVPEDIAAMSRAFRRESAVKEIPRVEAALQEIQERLARYRADAQGDA